MTKHFRRFLPHFIAVAAFAVLTAIYFYPAFQGMALKQGDVINYRGMVEEISQFRKMYGEEPLWTNSMFGGMPAFQISVFYPNNIVKMIDSALNLGLPRPASYLFLYLFGFYVLLISCKLKPPLAAIGAVAFAFSSYYFIILEAGHNTKAHAIAYMAPTLAGIIWTCRSRYLFGGAFAALFLALQIGANHVQITYYFGFLALLFVLAQLAEAISDKAVPRFAKAVGVLACAAVIAVAANANILWNTYEYGKYSTRGPSELTLLPDGSSNDEINTGGLDRDYVTQWSYGKAETLTFLVPNAMGGASEAMLNEEIKGNNPELFNLGVRFYQAQNYVPSSYWGEQPFTSGPVYVGALVCLLFLLGLVFVKGPVKWALLAAALLTTALGWGKNLMPLTDFFLDVVPGYDKFRAVTIILSVTEVILPLLGFLFLKKLYDNPDLLVQERKRFFAVAGSLAGFLLLLLAMPDAFFNFMSQRDQEFFLQAIDGPDGNNALRYMNLVKEERISQFRGDVLRSLVFVAAGSILLWLFAKRRMKNIAFFAALAAIVLIDMWPVNKRYLNNEKERGKYIQWQPAAASASAHSAATADLTILELESDLNPRVKDAVAAAAADMRNELRAQRTLKVTDEELNESRFAALRFNTNYRVFTLLNPFNDARVAYFHKSIGGYHGAKLKRYQELITWHLEAERNELIAGMQNAPTRESLMAIMRQSEVLNMLNTKYIIYNNDAGPLLNSAALGSAWFVKDIRIAANADEEITMLGAISTADEALVDRRYADQVEGFAYSPDSVAAIAVEEHLPNYIKYIYASEVPQAAIFSEIHYEAGWNAYLDGGPVPHFRANYVLRGMVVPAGNHTIEFRFEPESYAYAATLSTAAGLLLAALVALALYQRFRQREEEIDF